MPKVSKLDLKAHKEALELLAKPRDLTQAEILFVLDHYVPDAAAVTEYNIFFTPRHVADIAALMSCEEAHILDMCAGIGRLAYHLLLRRKGSGSRRLAPITALEINPDLVKVGKKLMPEVNWFEGNVFDPDVYHRIGAFDLFMSNPPYRAVPKGQKSPLNTYRGRMDLMIAEIGLVISSEHGGTAVFEQGICPEIFSGNDGVYKVNEGMAGESLEFMKAVPGVEWRVSPFDTTASEGRGNGQSGFADTGVLVEVCDLAVPHSRRAQVEQRRVDFYGLPASETFPDEGDRYDLALLPGLPAPESVLIPAVGANRSGPKGHKDTRLERAGITQLSLFDLVSKE